MLSLDHSRGMLGDLRVKGYSRFPVSGAIRVWSWRTGEPRV